MGVWLLVDSNGGILRPTPSFRERVEKETNPSEEEEVEHREGVIQMSGTFKRQVMEKGK